MANKIAETKEENQLLEIEKLLAKWDSLPDFASDFTDEWLNELH